MTKPPIPSGSRNRLSIKRGALRLSSYEQASGDEDPRPEDNDQGQLGQLE